MIKTTLFVILFFIVGTLAEATSSKKIIVLGAGYVGTVTGACLAHMGHQVTLIDPDEEKIKLLKKRKSPILEPHLEELISQGVDQGYLTFRTDLEIADADCVMIAVPTPTTAEGVVQTDCLQQAFQSLAQTTLKGSLIICVRSTIPPHYLRQLEEVFLKNKPGISLVANPEFLRESSAVHDFFHPPFCIVGGDDPEAVDRVLSFYKPLCSKRFGVSLETASLIKYACNAFHALKIAFTNEISSLCETLQIDPVELMQIFSQDQQLNCSAAYLKPGFAFGGSCLPKDLRTLVSLGKSCQEPLPLLSAILPSNQQRLDKVFHQILAKEHKKVAVLGMSFKKNSDDLRESPFMQLMEKLYLQGVQLHIYDPDVQPHLLIATNRQLLFQRYLYLLPCIKSDLEEALENCDGIILCKNLLSKPMADQLQSTPIPIYDLHYNLYQPCR